MQYEKSDLQDFEEQISSLVFNDKFKKTISQQFLNSKEEYLQENSKYIKNKKTTLWVLLLLWIPTIVIVALKIFTNLFTGSIQYVPYFIAASIFLITCITLWILIIMRPNNMSHTILEDEINNKFCEKHNEILRKGLTYFGIDYKKTGYFSDGYTEPETSTSVPEIIFRSDTLFFWVNNQKFNVFEEKRHWQTTETWKDKDGKEHVRVHDHYSEYTYVAESYFAKKWANFNFSIQNAIPQKNQLKKQNLENDQFVSNFTYYHNDDIKIRELLTVATQEHLLEAKNVFDHYFLEYEDGVLNIPSDHIGLSYYYINNVSNMLDKYQPICKDAAIYFSEKILDLLFAVSKSQILYSLHS